MRHVLIVDDNDSMRHSLADVLESEGLSVELASDGAQALAALQRRVPDLVLLDLQLPKIPGADVAEHLHRLPHPPALLVLSASSSTAELSRDIGADAFLPKPFDLTELLAVVDRLLGR